MKQEKEKKNKLRQYMMQYRRDPGSLIIRIVVLLGAFITVASLVFLIAIIPVRMFPCSQQL